MHRKNQPSPGYSAGFEWPDAPRLAARGIRASERRDSTRCDVPIGTIVQTFERSVYKFSRGRCSVSFALVTLGAEGKAELIDLPHRTLRARPVYEVTLPDGSKLDVPRRED